MKTPPELQAAYLNDHGPGLVGSLVQTLAQRFGVEPHEIGVVMFFCTGGHNVQMCSNLTHESVSAICAGFGTGGDDDEPANTH